MGASERRNKSQANAADLLRRGFWHGRRQSKPTHSNYPNLTDVGSAAYRRLQQSRLMGRSKG